MSKKSERISALLSAPADGRHSPHYLGFFDCFNKGLFYEAHDVLEDQWLRERKGPRDAFYKGLIQLAGAFVHLQKNRLKPAEALLRLAESNMRLYPSRFEDLDLAAVVAFIQEWRRALEAGHFEHNPITTRPPPKLFLECTQPTQNF